MGGVNSNQTLVPEMYALLWNTRGAFKDILRPKNSWTDFGKRRRRREAALAEWEATLQGKEGVDYSIMK